MARLLSALALAAGLTSCSRLEAAGETFPIGDPSTRRVEAAPSLQAPGPCNPLAPIDVPITLAQPLAVGRAPDGTTYVVDHVGGADSRSFLAVQGTHELHRQADEGPSESGPDYVWEGYGTGEHLLVLRIDAEAWHAGRLGPQHFAMARLGSDDPRQRLSQAMTSGEQLQILPSRSVDGWLVHNRPQHFRVQHAARTEDGRWLVTTHPEVPAFDPEQVRVFFGPAEALQEQKLVSIIHERDGGTTHIRFTLDGGEAKAFFPFRCTSAQTGEQLWGIGACPGSLALPQGALTVHHLRREESVPGDLRYICGSATGVP